MPSTKSLILIVASLISTSCASVSVPESEDAAVLSAIVQDRCARAKSGDPAKYSVLSTQISAIDDTFAPDGLERSAVKSLFRRNKNSHPLPSIELCPAFKLVEQTAIDVAMDRKEPDGSSGWPGFYKAFPGASGMTYLSLPGYSRDGTTAVVQVAGACGLLCGSGFYWVLRKVNGQWVVDSSVPGWVS